MRDLIKDYLGYAAAFCTTFAFVPQAIKVYQTRKTHDISLYLFLIFSVGVGIWLVYGILIDDLPLIVSNSVTLLLSLFILVYKIRYQ